MAFDTDFKLQVDMIYYSERMEFNTTPKQRFREPRLSRIVSATVVPIACRYIDHTFRYRYSEKENQAENYYGLLDRSWRSTAQYEEEMLDIDQEFVYEDFVSLLTKVNTDLGVSDVDQDSAVLNTDVQGDHADLPESL